MDTHRLKYFLRIAEEGSITRAAAVLGIAQPALSRQIRLLEEDLGITLFERTRRGVHLTDVGREAGIVHGLLQRRGGAGPARTVAQDPPQKGEATFRTSRG